MRSTANGHRGDPDGEHDRARTHERAMSRHRAASDSGVTTLAKRIRILVALIDPDGFHAIVVTNEESRWYSADIELLPRVG